MRTVSFALSSLLSPATLVFPTCRFWAEADQMIVRQLLLSIAVLK